MASNITAITGVNADSLPTSADVISEARKRQTERLRAAQAANEKVTEVVEQSESEDGVSTATARDPNPRYRVNLDPGTGRLNTEVLDSLTGDVILRIPPTYVDPDDGDAAGPAAAETAGEDADDQAALGQNAQGVVP